MHIHTLCIGPHLKETHENCLHFANSLEDLELPWNFIQYITILENALNLTKINYLIISLIVIKAPHSKPTFSMVTNANRVVEVNHKNYVLLLVHLLLLKHLFGTISNKIFLWFWVEFPWKLLQNSLNLWKEKNVWEPCGHLVPP